MVSHPPTFYNRERTTMWERQRQSTQNAASRLMRLPREIRDYVYEFVVVEENPIEIVEVASPSVGYSRSHYRLSPALQNPALARVSTQLRREVMPIFYSHFYSHNKFNITAISTKGVYAQEAESIVGRWLCDLSVADQTRLRKIGICSTLSSEALISGRSYSQLYNLAVHRTCGGVDYEAQYASVLRLKGWTWEGDVKTADECDEFCAPSNNVKPGEMHHHALVWTG